MKNETELILRNVFFSKYKIEKKKKTKWVWRSR